MYGVRVQILHVCVSLQTSQETLLGNDPWATQQNTSIVGMPVLGEGPSGSGKGMAGQACFVSGGYSFQGKGATMLHYGDGLSVSNRGLVTVRTVRSAERVRTN